MDNFRIDVTCEGREALSSAFDIAFRGKAAVGYRVEPEIGLVLYWTASPKMVPLPFRMSSEGAVDFVTRWLAEQDYGREPDHDGSNGRGWRVYNEAWGHVGGEYQAFLAVQPSWAMYGK